MFHVLVSILEEKPIGSTVVLLSVSDEDNGGNGQFVCSYENIDENEFGKFEVKTTKKGCEVQNIKILDWSQNNIYSLKVHVTDKAPAKIRKSDSVTVTIKVSGRQLKVPLHTMISRNDLWSRNMLSNKVTTKKGSGIQRGHIFHNNNRLLNMR